jgi:transcriptional regulator of acetoin/glycerol metabolism
MIHSFYNQRDIMFTSGVDAAHLKAISQYKDLFLGNAEDPGPFFMLEPEVAASWQRSKKLKIDPEMQELSYVLRPQEFRALLQDKKTYIDLAKSYFYAFLPLLNMPKAAFCIQDENGTFLDFTDQDQLLTLSPTRGSIWREETVGTSSTSLCLESGKIVQLAGPRHYCKALENQLATTTPIYDDQGSKLGLVTVVNDIGEVSRNEQNLQRILCWISALRIMLETKLALLRRSYMLNGSSLYKESPRLELEREGEFQHPEEHPAGGPFTGILGESPQIQRVLRTVERFAHSDCGILLTGESGTGKELFARAIHQAGGRSGPFVAINCAALPGNLIASELFGYVGGAFTGAENKGRLGKIELAKDGTLFLDEIGDMPLEIQPTLLRVLEDKKVTRLGSNKDVQVDFRLIAGTNADLFQLVQEKKFRADLYYRLETLLLELPPLRERGRDILLMANHFLGEISAQTGRGPLKLGKDTEVFLLNYTWPGNIRQLKNAMLYATNVCQGKVILPQDLPASLFRNSDIALPKAELTKFPLSSLQEMEQDSIKRALFLTGNNVRVAAKMLGLSKTSIYRKVKEYRIDLKENI